MWCDPFILFKKYNFFLWEYRLAVIPVKLLKNYVKIWDGRKAKLFPVYSNVFYFCNLSVNIYLDELHSNTLIFLIRDDEQKGR